MHYVCITLWVHRSIGSVNEPHYDLYPAPRCWYKKSALQLNLVADEVGESSVFRVCTPRVSELTRPSQAHILPIK